VCRELLDDALLRPGRLEVQLEVPLPCTSGRREILNIHFGVLRSKGRLSCPLCCAIDGIPIRSNNDNGDVRPFSKRQQMKEFAGKALRPLSAIKEMGVVDLASDEYTGGFSGADIAGVF
jgi:SpoVK/Ycf46/Vps4 family AAA+-type ATPase